MIKCCSQGRQPRHSANSHLGVGDPKFSQYGRQAVNNLSINGPKLTAFNKQHRPEVLQSILTIGSGIIL